MVNQCVLLSFDFLNLILTLNSRTFAPLCPRVRVRAQPTCPNPHPHAQTSMSARCLVPCAHKYGHGPLNPCPHPEPAHTCLNPHVRALPTSTQTRTHVLTPLPPSLPQTHEACPCLNYAAGVHTRGRVPVQQPLTRARICTCTAHCGPCGLTYAACPRSSCRLPHHRQRLWATQHGACTPTWQQQALAM